MEKSPKKRPSAAATAAEAAPSKRPFPALPASTLVPWGTPVAGAGGDGRAGAEAHTAELRVADLETPCFVLYRRVVEANARRMLERARELRCELRPHVKTHKTLEVGALCTGGTRRKIAVSTLAEAEFFADGGFDDILYAVSVAPQKLARAAALASRLEQFHITLDHEATLAAVLQRPPCDDKQWSVFLMVDCGYGRDGVDPRSEGAQKLALALGSAKNARLAGLYTHGGHSYDVGEAADPAAEVRLVAEQEARSVAEFAAELRKSGLEVPVVGIGSTPTCSNPPQGGLPGVTEMHPGNYCYYDVMQQSLGSCQEEDIAVRVVTRVIGHYPERNLLVIDMGWTACSKQGEEAGFGRIEGHPELTVAGLKQEAGLVKSTSGESIDFSKHPIGSTLRIEPHHSCAHTKQHDRVHVLGDDHDQVEDVWRICHGW